MIVNVKVMPSACKNTVKEEGGVLKVYVTVAPEKGKANEALVEALARHFCVAKNAVRIIRGASSRHKRVQIEK